MKRLFVLYAQFLQQLLSMGVTAAAVNDVVDMSNSTHGYVTVNYSSSARLKVGIQYNGGKTVFYDCPSGRMLPSLSIRATASTPRNAVPQRFRYVLSAGRVQVHERNR